MLKCELQQSQEENKLQIKRNNLTCAGFRKHTHARIPNRTSNAQVFKIALCFHLQPK